MGSLTRDLMELARKKWMSSGLTDEVAEKLRLTPLDRDEVQQLGANFHAARGLKIPYFDHLGRQTEFFRLRYLEPLPGLLGQAEKPQRYVQPARTINEVYMPPILDRSWDDIADDNRSSIFITEGELKSASASSMGFPTIGLGGVDVWRAKRRLLELLPGLDRFDWNGRRIYIVYDSDASTNSNVVRAQLQLATELTARGAFPIILSLPAAEDGSKQGLDDFLVARGPAAFTELIEKAPGFLEAEALWELNDEVVYIRDPGLVVVRTTDQKLAPSAFVSHAYANRHYLEQKMSKKGMDLVKKPLAKRWLEWEQRFTLGKVTYEPGKDRLADGNWNQWKGWGCQPVQGDIGPWTKLLDFLFKDKTKERQWFERWLAYPIQHPGTKLYTASVLWSVEHGTGKTLVAYIMKHIYGDNFIEIKNKDLKGSFNEWGQNKQFIYADEITGQEGKRADADLIKGLITQEWIRINAKFVPTFVLPDCGNYYIASNHPDTVYIEDTDRRFFVHEIVGGPASFDLYRLIDRWYRGTGPQHLFHWLLNLDLGDFDPHAPAIQTTAKQAMIRDNKSDVGTWVLRLKEDPESCLRIYEESIKTGCDLFTPEMLMDAYDQNKDTKVTKNGLSRELKRGGFRQINDGRPIRTILGLQRLYAIRNVEKWESKTPAECAEHFNSMWGKGKF